jgi:endonuclease/exonuclease/phosphatase family metal-dependent hydrolase
VTEAVPELTPVPPAERHRLLGRLGPTGEHRRAFRELPALDQVRVVDRPPVPLPGEIRVLAWNVERGRHAGEILSALDREGVDVALLTELDVGMARSGNVDTVEVIGSGLGHSSLFGVEFVELGLGNDAETAAAGPDAVNHVGLHGNAVVAAGALIEPRLVRIETDGYWFAPGSREPRVGGRVAVAALLDAGRGALAVASVHLESDSDPAHRAGQLETVLDAVDGAYGRDTPAVVGGDLNTFSTSLAELSSPGVHRRLGEEDSSRWWWPVPHEPLFEVATEHGFDVSGANEARPTYRLAALQGGEGLPRLDWILTRGVLARGARTIPAVGAQGNVLSDHDAVAVTVSLPG